MSSTTTPTERLFSYGTLRLRSVQLATFGRRLAGTADVLTGFALATVEIGDPQVVATSGKARHSIIRFTGREADVVSGIVFSITPDELRHADRYEVAAYRRIAVMLRSGVHAWAYVDAGHVPPAR